jgi:hypothetical protein
MKSNGSIKRPEILPRQEIVQKALRDAVQEALRMHKLLGHPIFVGKDGKVVEISAEDIKLDEPHRNGKH